MTIESFRKMNPDWEIVLCMSNVIQDWSSMSSKRDFVKYNGINYFDKIKDLDVRIEPIDLTNDFHGKTKTITPIHYSDLYRYHKLYTEGGFYADMDIIFFKPMDEMLADMELQGNTAIYFNKRKRYVAIGFLGAEKGNRFFKDLITFATNKLANRHLDQWEAYGEILIYNLLKADPKKHDICTKIEEKYQELKVYNIPDSLVYHYDFTCVEKAFSNNSARMINGFPPVSIGYHWYGGHPLSIHFNGTLSDTSYMNHATLFSDIYKRISE